MQRLIADYATQEAFAEACAAEVANGGVLIRGQAAGAEPECLVEFRISGVTVAEAIGRIGAAGRFGVTVTFDEPPANVLAVANAPAAAPEPEPEPEKSEEPARGTAADRVAKLTVAQKIAAATSGDRETRLAIFRDVNKTLHMYVLRNPRIQLDEVQAAAKMNSLSPDALKAIADHKEFGQNLAVQTSLVRNPKTPMPIAMRLLPRLPQNEIRAIAKGGARDQLVGQAKKILSGEVG